LAAHLSLSLSLRSHILMGSMVHLVPCRILG
jgi:hypothetical protein